MPALLYGAGHGYGNPLSGSGFERTVAAITRERSRGVASRLVPARHATLIVTGDTTLAAIVPELEKAFSAWKRGTGARQARRAGERRSGGRVSI